MSRAVRLGICSHCLERTETDPTIDLLKADIKRLNGQVALVEIDEIRF